MNISTESHIKHTCMPVTHVQACKNNVYFFFTITLYNKFPPNEFVCHITFTCVSITHVQGCENNLSFLTSSPLINLFVSFRWTKGTRQSLRQIHTRMSAAYFHRGISRLKGEELLQQAKEDGSFLVRDSETLSGAYVLCLL